MATSFIGELLACDIMQCQPYTLPRFPLVMPFVFYETLDVRSQLFVAAGVHRETWHFGWHLLERGLKQPDKSVGS
jgi:hypothetical protein